MGGNCELSYCELRAKEIINTADGRRLGRIVDIVFSGDNGEVKGIVVPYVRKFFFSRSQEIFIPWSCINKIGDDVILVHIIGDGFPRGQVRGRKGYDSYYCCPPPPPPQDCPNACPPPCDDSRFDCDCNRDCPPPNACPPDDCRPDCDGKCEKCMLFDCAYRWKNHC